MATSVSEWIDIEHMTRKPKSFIIASGTFSWWAKNCSIFIVITKNISNDLFTECFKLRTRFVGFLMGEKWFYQVCSLSNVWFYRNISRTALSSEENSCSFRVTFAYFWWMKSLKKRKTAVFFPSHFQEIILANFANLLPLCFTHKRQILRLCLII